MKLQGQCPSPNDLNDLLHSNLSGEVENTIEAHLETCTECQSSLEQLAAAPDFVEDAGRRLRATNEQMPSGLQAAINQLKTRFGHDNTRMGALPTQNFNLVDLLEPTDSAATLGRLGRYEVIEELGRGGMGIVVKARDPALNRTVAIKLLAPFLAAEDNARQRFVNEGRAAASINHVNVVTIFDVDEFGGIPFLVMEIVDGETLQQRLQNEHQLPLSDVVRLGSEVAAGLEAAHERGLIHRDVKPANILLESKTGTAKLTDFGLARATQDDHLTRSGVVAGTPAYMAPEQAGEQEVDHRADLFSLGSVLYAAITGQQPFQGNSVLAVIRKVADQAAPPIAELRPNTPPPLIDLIDSLQQKAAEDRVQTAREVVEYLELALDESAAKTQRILRPQKNKKNNSIVSTTVGILAAAALGFLTVTYLPPLLTGPNPGPHHNVNNGGPNNVGPHNIGPHNVGPNNVGPNNVHQNGGPINHNLPLVPHSEQRFVIKRHGGEIGFPELHTAIHSAISGDTIVIRQSGNIHCNRVNIGDKVLRIVAGQGFHPVLKHTTNDSLFSTNQVLVLEGLEFDVVPSLPPDSSMNARRQRKVLNCFRGSIFATHCRFTQRGNSGFITTEATQNLHIQHCEFYASLGHCVEWRNTQTSARIAEFHFDNCVLTGESFFLIPPIVTQSPLDLNVQRSAITSKRFIQIVRLANEPVNRNARIRLHAEHNVFGGESVVAYLDTVDHSPNGLDKIPLWIRGMVAWSGDSNRFSPKTNFFTILPQKFRAAGSTVPEWSPETIEEWSELWRNNVSNSLIAPNLWAEGGKSPAGGFAVWLGPKDFELKKPESNVFGIDATLIGPGQPYHLWKKSPQGAKWEQQISVHFPR
jgi:serine/threonine protein kinase